MRYKFYREHKYVSFAVNDLERQIAKTNFRSFEQMAKVKNEFETLVHMLKEHANYENSALHELLRKKNSAVYAQIEKEHDHYDELLDDLFARLEKILELPHADGRVEAGYQFYLSYRKFAGENLLHLHEEETVILPELQRLYTDEELKAVESATYQMMTAVELVHMMEVLFPHMNPDDKEAFLTDIKDSQPEKFIAVWADIQAQLSEEERANMIEKLGLHAAGARF